MPRGSVVSGSITSPPMAPTLMAPEGDKHQGGSRAHAEADGLEVWTGRDRSRSLENRAMMHKSTTVATATVTMGTCTFLIALTPVRFRRG